MLKTKKRPFFEIFLQIVRSLACLDPKCGEFCGLFYKNIQGWVQTLQFGGTFPAGPVCYMDGACHRRLSAAGLFFFYWAGMKCRNKAYCMPGDIIWISNNPLSSGKGSGKTDRFDCIETARICWQTARDSVRSFQMQMG